MQSQATRSKTYQSIFGDKQMLEAFGTLRPSVSERTAYFFESWMDWRHNRVKLKPRVDQPCKNMLKELGLKEFWEYQVREGEVRFNTDEIKAWALMSGLVAYVKKVKNERV
jgi:hypothetical protein